MMSCGIVSCTRKLDQLSTILRVDDLTTSAKGIEQGKWLVNSSFSRYKQSIMLPIIVGYNPRRNCVEIGESPSYISKELAMVFFFFFFCLSFFLLGTDIAT